MLINMIGSDGGGKTTVIDSLEDWIRTEKSLKTYSLNKWMVLDREQFPECRFMNCSESEMKNDISHMESENRFIFLLFLYSTSILKVADHRAVIFVDGYWWKHFAVEQLHGIDRQWMANASAILPVPDLTILLDVDPRIACKRKGTLTRYECGLREINEENFVEHQTRLRRVLLELAGQNGWEVIDANQGKERVLAEAQSIIDRHLARSPVATNAHRETLV